MATHQTMKKITKGQVKELRELSREKKSRDNRGLFLAEGVKIVGDIVDKEYALESIVVTRDFIDDEGNKDLLSKIEEKSIAVFETGKADFERISSLRSSQGILAVAKKPDFSIGDLPSSCKTLAVLCDGIQDPGNLGAIIRTAVAFGADRVLLAGDSVDLFNPKVVRASSGMVLDIPVYECDEKTLERFKKEGYCIFAGESAKRDTEDIGEIKVVPAKLIIAFGSEGKGLSPEVSSLADECFHIPMQKEAESLNVTTAVAISLYVFTKLKG